MEGGSRFSTFLDEFDPNHISKLEKLTLKCFMVSVEQLKILSKKLTSNRLTKLDLSSSFGFTGNLSALFTHSFPTLNTLKLGKCKLNANDLQSLARANVDGKLPQLRHLGVTWHDDIEISDLFTHSAQWNQLTSLKGAPDLTIPNVEHDLLTSLEELHVSGCPQVNHLPPVTRCWSGLKTIELYCGECLLSIADGVERGMFPDLTIVRCDDDENFLIGKLSLFKLLKANIFVRHTGL